MANTRFHFRSVSSLAAFVIKLSNCSCIDMDDVTIEELDEFHCPECSRINGSRSTCACETLFSRLLLIFVLDSLSKVSKGLHSHGSKAETPRPASIPIARPSTISTHSSKATPSSATKHGLNNSDRSLPLNKRSKVNSSMNLCAP